MREIISSGAAAYPPRSRGGFTLVEMSVVLIVIGLVMLSVFPAMMALRANAQQSTTQNNLNALMLATAAFVQANGCVPCPALASAFGNSFGFIPSASSASPCGSCNISTAEGIPPFMSLGISRAVAHDGWGHWITMRVDPALTTAPSNSANCATGNSCSVFVPPTAACVSVDATNGFCSATAAQFGYSQKGLCAANLRTSSKAAPIQVFQTGTTSYQNAAVLFVSHGAKGYGAYIADASLYGTGNLNGCRYGFPSSGSSTGSCPSQPTCPSGGPSTCTSGTCFAQCNASNTLQFVNATMAKDYDDQMVYADRNTLVSMLGNRSCQTVW